jgi:hypothetical protein
MDASIHTSRKPSNKTSRDEHADIDGASLKSAANDVDKGSNHKRNLAAIGIAAPANEQPAKDSASREEPKSRANQRIGPGIIWRCWIGREAHVCIPSGLAHSCGDDTEVITVGNTSQCEGEDDLMLTSVICTTAAAAEEEEGH